MGFSRCIGPCLSSPCQLNCANLITSLGSDADGFRRYVCALDLHEKEKPHGLFSHARESQRAVVDRLLRQVSPSRIDAFEHIKQAKHNIVFIQGPSGTGKTTFIVTFLQILWHSNHPWITCAPSNSACNQPSRNSLAAEVSGNGYYSFLPI